MLRVRIDITLRTLFDRIVRVYSSLGTILSHFVQGGVRVQIVYARKGVVIGRYTRWDPSDTRLSGLDPLAPAFGYGIGESITVGVQGGHGKVPGAPVRFFYPNAKQTPSTERENLVTIDVLETSPDKILFSIPHVPITTTIRDIFHGIQSRAPETGFRIIVRYGYLHPLGLRLIGESKIWEPSDIRLCDLPRRWGIPVPFGFDDHDFIEVQGIIRSPHASPEKYYYRPPSETGKPYRVQILCVDDPDLSRAVTLRRRSGIQVLYRRLATLLGLRKPFSLDWNGPGGATADHLRRPLSVIDTPPVIRLRVNPRPGAAAFPWP